VSRRGQSNEVHALNRVAPTVDSIRQQILAVDGHSLLYRAYFALPDTIRDPHGRPVNAVHGFVSMLARLLRDHQPSGVLVAYDSPWPTIRHASFPGYKANRGVLPEALLAQVSISQAVLKRTGIPTLAVAGYEGDDILASLADYYSQHDSSVLIVTGDRDLFQLVRDPWVRVLYTKRGVGGEQVLDEEGVKRLVGVEPSRYPDLAALRGDLSDNIEGVAGIGEKTQ
jgi:DNA polymerase-1